MTCFNLAMKYETNKIILIRNFTTEICNNIRIYLDVIEIYLNVHILLKAAMKEFHAIE